MIKKLTGPFSDESLRPLWCRRCSVGGSPGFPGARGYLRRPEPWSAVPAGQDRTPFLGVFFQGERTLYFQVELPPPCAE